jgi:GTP-sensing pleiotropic transcriptional regulator CodY
MWCGIRTNPIHGCCDNPEELSYEDLLISVVPELANGLRLGTVVLSQDLSRAWTTIHG